MRVGSRQAWLGVIVLCLGWHGLAQAEAPKQDPKKLLAEGDRLADKEDYAGALLRYKEAYEQIVPKLRGLRFKESVNPGLMTREQLQKYMVELVTEELPEEKMVLMDRSLKAFGFVPATMLVKPTLMSLYSEEVAGFYHPKTKKIFLIKEADKPQPRGFLGALFGPPPDFDKDTQKVALAHEMAHALADQHFDLNALDEATKDDEDMAMALAAVIEGEATLVMMAEGMREGGGAQAVLKMSPQYV
ncbi:MAG: hypothetical protein HY000_02740, partial [Planctomycetes bacterium]|nr:hypothetical protein [Planctomycetota bacterium]